MVFLICRKGWGFWYLANKNWGGGSVGGVGWGDVLGGDFVLRGLNPFLKSNQIVMWLISHG